MNAMQGLLNWVRTDHWLWLLIVLFLITRWLPGYLQKTRTPSNDEPYGTPEDKKRMFAIVKGGVFFVFFIALIATFFFPKYASSPYLLIACFLGFFIFMLGVPLWFKKKAKRS